MYISGKYKLGCINGDLPQPQPTDSTFRKWRTDDAIVKGWLINSMDPTLISNFIRFPTAKMVWDSIAATYFDGTDTSQVYDLRKWVTGMRKAGGSIEKFYNDLQGLWREIDFCRPNPIEYAVDIQKYNPIIQEDRVYTFLDGLDDRLDKVLSDVLQQKPFQLLNKLMLRSDVKILVLHPRLKQNQKEEDALIVEARNIAVKLVSSYMDTQAGGMNSKLRNNKKLLSDGGLGKAALTTAELQLSFTSEVESSSNSATLNDQGNHGQVLLNSSRQSDCDCIIDSEATDHMTFDANNFSNVTQPRRTTIANANGVTYPVTGAGIVALSSSLSLSHTLFVPSLSNKLLSVSQVTAELNCVALMYPTFCLLQDIPTKEIIRRD
ncbi:hypothetical protein GH714_004320 [Hevea brasiliensis]|uniref:Retrovirus-related Pol polyprotein from transposon TNT 1-94-like beta-barrel domain-containing protein n=1 Tax=Hevea brasiliensis TaxID=3981 RepID=A0A6A6KJ44_HEVBR|nr:hypothetical protein GH714_004320 [Hevea brasiliensis]